MGASYGQEHSHSSTVDASISVSIKEEINSLFVEAELGVSATLSTGFKWSSSSSSTWSQKTTFTVTSVSKVPTDLTYINTQQLGIYVYSIIKLAHK